MKNKEKALGNRNMWRNKTKTKNAKGRKEGKK
jgi:hypothetical protein